MRMKILLNSTPYFTPISAFLYVVSFKFVICTLLDEKGGKGELT
jgi:hypothetical protein